MSVIAHLPGVRMVTTYRRAWLFKDIVAGLVLSTLLVPQGMAYAELAGLPAVTGLYTSVLCLLGYAIFGPSKVLVLGPDSSLGPMIAATILPLVGAGGDPVKAVALASILALLTGVTMVVAGVGKLGFVADLLSKPTMLGYMNGLSLTILISQLPKLLGFSVDSDNFMGDVVGLFKGVAGGEVVPAAAGIGILSLVIVMVLPKLLPKVPAILLAVLVAIGISAAAGLAGYGVTLVGVLPQGFPSLTRPDIAMSDVVPLLIGAAGIALVSLTDTVSTATAFASRRGEEVDADKEIIGIGASNIAAGLFQGFPVSTSGSRTAVAETAGAKTQVTGLVGAGVITLMLVAFPALLAYLPQPTLGAVVIAASLTLADIPATRRLLRQRPMDFTIAMTAFLGVAILGVLPGILVAVAISVAAVFRRVWWPHQALLGQVEGVPGFHDREQFPDARVLPGCTLFRFAGPLIFANARNFDEQIRKLAESVPSPTWIIVTAEPITDMDTTACDMLNALTLDLDGRGQRLVWAEVKQPVKDKMDRYGISKAIPEDRYFPTIEAAVAAYQELSGELWQNPPAT